MWKMILACHGDVEFVWIQFVPIHGAIRVRMIPIGEFSRMIEHGQKLSIASVITHALRNDHVAAGAKSTGVIYLSPDLSTASIAPLAADKHRLEIFAWHTTQNGIPISECPRYNLTRITQILDNEFGLYALVGFEIEIVFFNSEDGNFRGSSTSAPDSNHTWSAVTSDVRALLPMVEDIVRCLAKTQIYVQQFHAESAPGQWEIVLPPQRPLEAVDSLIRAREAIKLIAAEHGYYASLHPRPFSDHAGTGAHVHISVNPNELEAGKAKSADNTKIVNTDSFFAGIIDHFCSLMAFCLPLDVSYERAVAGIWSGGEYVSWGSQNRETPMRRITRNRFEIKLHCGTANPYASLSALMAAGIDGLRRDTLLTAGDCQEVPSQMTDAQRATMGICAKIPRGIEDSLNYLRDDHRIVDLLGKAYTDSYVAVTKEWNDYVSSMPHESQREWLLKNY
ncbi:hypothetical protein BDV34DRAFT_218538 [Aspergillus parasiticus]|uniref:Glutamine synthetase n=1 Tax=Aspergillus parasiticus TaxID=5067 RepID=A0A5N6D132_ASPPA|nr:hypothetical protein BDV34DRAFT_218538 [Aspergillus parasiticus]